MSIRHADSGAEPVLISFTKTDLRQLLPAAAYAQGSDYWLQGRVANLGIVAEPDGSLLITSEVKGSRHQRYHPRILVQQRRARIEFDASCTCPVGYLCKHVAATLLEAIESGEQVIAEQREQTRGGKSKSAESKPSATNHLGDELQNWLAQLATESRPQEGESGTRVRQQLVYLLKYKAQLKRLQLHLVVVRLLKNGSYGSWYPFKGQDGAYLREEDKRLLQWLKLYQSAEQDFRIELDSGAADMLRQILKTGRCHWDTPGQALLHLGETRHAAPDWQLAMDGLQRLNYQVEGDAPDYVLPLSPPWYLDLQAGQCGPLETGLPDRIAGLLLQAPALQPQQIEQVRQRLEAEIQVQLPQPQAISNVRQREFKPAPHLRLFNAELLLENYRYGSYSEDTLSLPLASLSFFYQHLQVGAYSDPKAPLNYFSQQENVLVQVPRQSKLEQQAIRQLQALGFKPLHAHPAYADLKQADSHRDALYLDIGNNQQPMATEQALLNFNLYEVPKLREQGWQVEMDGNYLFQVVDPGLLDDWYVEVEDHTGIDWFGLELGITLEGERINLLPLLVELLQKLASNDELATLQALPDETLLTPRLADGRILPLPLGRVRDIIAVLVELLDQEPLDRDGKLRMLTLRAAQLVELEAAMNAAQLRWFGGERVLELGRRLQNFQGIQAVKLPPSFQTELRPYQQEGLNWMQFLREYRLAGVLADDMGLGKTVQALAHILVEKHSGRADLPCLVVAPTSLMMNWRLESQRFTPDLKVLTLHGPERQAYFDNIADYDVVLTTYPLLHRDKAVLQNHSYHLLILDEAQHIKNPKAKATQIAHQLQARHRLCLTGTPMENHLGELWSLFHFLQPGLLGDLPSFRRLFRNPIEKDGDPSRREILARRIAPFLLRRTKEGVVKELPEKNEIIRSVELEGNQRDLYETIRLAMHDKVRKEIAAKGMARSQLIILDALLKLRQVCCDPRLLKLDIAKQVKTSAKLDLLMDLVPEMVEEGRKILIFSQFTSMLSLIERGLKKHKLEYSKLTGQTRDREAVINRFQSGEVPIFLISLKAGGTGLNLTAADTVIHYDPWWNPAVENQATDRAHRIGQDKKVFVYKLLTVGTVEEKIQVLQARKQQLADALFGEDQGASKFSEADLDALFEPL